MFIVAGAPGSGKSTLLPLSAFEVAFFNADDHAAKLNGGSYHAIPQAVRDRVNIDFTAFIAERIRCHESFAVETTLRTDAALLQAAQARSAGFRTQMFYIATENIAINLRRIIARAQGGGHSAPEKTLRKIHAASYATFSLAIAGVGASLDQLTVFDNSKPMEYLKPVFRLTVSKDGILSLEPRTVPEYLRPYLRLAANRLAVQNTGV
jgi:predicted ABC-type ATPase